MSLRRNQLSLILN